MLITGNLYFKKGGRCTFWCTNNIMLCPNCNQPVNDGAAFCGSCGATIATEATQDPQEVQTAVATAPQETETDNFNLNTGDEKPAKKPFKIKKPIIFAGIAVVLIAVILLNMTSIIGFFMRTFASPEKYMSYVELTNLKESSDSVLGMYNVYKKNVLVSSAAGESEIKLNVGEDAIRLLEGALAMSGTDDIELDFLNEIALSIDSNSKDNKSNLGITAKVSGKEVVEGRMYIDYEDGVMYIGLPDLNDQYLCYELPASAMDDMSVAMEDLQELYGDLGDALPSSKQIKKCLTKYAKAAIGAIDDVTKEKESVTVDGMTQKLTKLTLTVSNEMLNDVAIAVLEEMVADKELKKIVGNIQEVVDKYGDELGVDDIDLYDSMIEGITDELDNLKEQREAGEVSDDALGKLVTYVNNKNEVVGREIINVNYDGDEETVISYCKVKKGNKFNFELIAGEEEFVVTGSGKETKSSISGEFEIEVEGEDILTVTVSDFNTKKIEKGTLKGKITIKPGDGFFDLVDMDSSASSLVDLADIAIELSFDIEAFKSNDMTLSVMMDDEVFAGISVSAKTKKAKNVTLPKDYVDIEDADEWAEDIDFDKLIDSLEAAGFPDVITEALEQLVGYSSVPYVSLY